jgi:alginate O-acetyltransferase complex protein AlgI
MVFSTWTFAVFFAIFLPFYYVVRGDIAKRNWVILIASYIFYGWWNPKFVTLLALLAVVDFMAAKGVSGQAVTRRDWVWSTAFTAVVTLLSAYFAKDGGAELVLYVALFFVVYAVLGWWAERKEGDARRKAWLWVSVAANLGVLAFFKYFNFFLENVFAAMQGAGWQGQSIVLDIILPIGLSFHVFQGLARTLDCYRGEIKAEGSLVTVAAYLAFFPQLVAGPIERAERLIPQFERPAAMTLANMKSGAQLFLWGLLLKLVVADNMAPLSDAAFKNPSIVTGGAALAGALAFTFQIYCDFHGYSTMARGVARFIGFELMHNFKYPYFARSPSEFWRRWHISLSTWLRDYLYIALGGSRGSSLMTYRNLIITMVLGGLWHGAGWAFIAWGFFHGVVQAIYKVFGVDGFVDRLSQAGAAQRVLSSLALWALLFALTVIGWVFFRATTLSGALAMLGAIFSFSDWRWSHFAPIAAYVLPLLAVEYLLFKYRIDDVFSVGPFIVRFTLIVVGLMVVMVASAPPGRAFVYFDF